MSQVLAARLGGNVQLLGVLGSDREIAEAAWASTAACDGRSDEDVAKVIRFLARANPIHWRPFSTGGMVKFRIRCPSLVWDQWRRHHIGITRMEGEDVETLQVLWQQEEDERGYSSESRRYVDSPLEFMKTGPDFWRKRNEGKKKTGSSEEPLAATDAQHQEELRKGLLRHFENYYRDSLAAGVSPEQARMDIPRTYYSAHVEVGSIYAFARICLHRIHPEAEGPIQEYAKAVDDILETYFPVAWPALMACGKPAAKKPSLPEFTADELKVIRGMLAYGEDLHRYMGFADTVKTAMEKCYARAEALRAAGNKPGGSGGQG